MELSRGVRLSFANGGNHGNDNDLPVSRRKRTRAPDSRDSLLASSSTANNGPGKWRRIETVGRKLSGEIIREEIFARSLEIRDKRLLFSSLSSRANSRET